MYLYVRIFGVNFFIELNRISKVLINLVGRFKGSVKLDGELVLGGEIILFFVSLWFFIFLMMLFGGELM